MEKAIRGSQVRRGPPHSSLSRDHSTPMRERRACQTPPPSPSSTIVARTWLGSRRGSQSQERSPFVRQRVPGGARGGPPPKRGHPSPLRKRPTAPAPTRGGPPPRQASPTLPPPAPRGPLPS